MNVFWLLLLLALLLALWRTLLWRPRPVTGLTRRPPLFIGHRGVRGPRPENTLAAFELAFASGLDGIETDLQRTADGAIVLHHDFALEHRPITELTLAELRRREPGLATLDELFALARRYSGTLLNLELKARGWRTGGLERAVARQVRASGLAERVLISSFSPLSLARLRLWAPELRVGLLYAPELPRWLAGGALAGWLHADALHPHESLATPELLRRAHARGLMVNTWTVNAPMRITSLYALGADAIMGDDPAVLRRAAPDRAREHRDESSDVRSDERSELP